MQPWAGPTLLLQQTAPLPNALRMHPVAPRTFCFPTARRNTFQVVTCRSSNPASKQLEDLIRSSGSPVMMWMSAGIYSNKVGLLVLVLRQSCGIIAAIQSAPICGNRKGMEKRKRCWKRNGPKNIMLPVILNGLDGFTEFHISTGGQDASIMEFGDWHHSSLFTSLPPV